MRRIASTDGQHSGHWHFYQTKKKEANIQHSDIKFVFCCVSAPRQQPSTRFVIVKHLYEKDTTAVH